MNDGFLCGFTLGLLGLLFCLLVLVQFSDQPTSSQRQVKCLELEIGKEKCDLIFNFKKE